MEELINKITETAGVTPEQAAKAVEAVKEFVKEKFPMLSGAVDNMFGASSGTSSMHKAADEPLK